ncbi:MAG TPA: 5-formyltetrahydrofolate cyclo-ligase [Polyangiaceae bacterium]|nr:5-formyltetrahydrofolate cyclo-ligase [Polyangiaceae bacterium]
MTPSGFDANAGRGGGAHPPPPDAALIQRARDRVRAGMRATRKAIGSAAVAARSERIVASLLSLAAVQQARAAGLFWPRISHGEVDLRPLDRALRERGVALYYPFMDVKGQGYTTGFRRVLGIEELQPRGRGFAEPSPAASEAARGDLDLLIVPALAATPEGHRLGYGSGFYDVTLPDFCPPAVTLIVVFSFQLIGEMPILPHDVACDGVVSDRQIHDPRGVLAASQSR